MIPSRSFFCLRSKYGWIRSRKTRAQRYARRACMGLAQPEKTARVKKLNVRREVNLHLRHCTTNARCLEPVSVTDVNLPCIGVPANPNRVGKLCLESWESAESAGEHKVEETPQFA